MDLGIAGKWALVCGASKGLGLGCAQALVGEGVNLVINARAADALLVAGCPLSHSGCCESRCAVAQTACRSRARYRQLSSDPTSGPSELRCSKSAVFASYKHSFSLRQILCCIDQLNPQAIAVFHIAERTT